MFDRYLTEAGQNALFTAVLCVATTALGTWILSDHGFIESLNFAMLLWAWFVIAVAVGRVLYLPIQYARHRLALRKVERRERELSARASKGDAQAVIALHVRSYAADPREVPWWQW